MAALSAMCPLSGLEVESLHLQTGLQRSNSKKDAQQSPTSASPPSPSLKASAANTVAQRWSKETIKAMETHLSLLGRRPNNNTSRASAASAFRKLCPEEQRQQRRHDSLVDLTKSLQGPLPCGWEQHLDLRTGEVYYVDWKSCKRSTVDPRKALLLANHNIDMLLQQTTERWEFQSDLTQLEDERTKRESMQDCSYTINGSMIAGKDDNFEDDNVCEAQSKWNPSNIENPSKSDATSPEECRLELLKCNHCLFHIIVHAANPWCPHCGCSLV